MSSTKIYLICRMNTTKRTHPLIRCFRCIAPIMLVTITLTACNDEIVNRTVPTPTNTHSNLLMGRYLPMDNGRVVRDVETGLEWQRCALGKQWNPLDNSCEGNALRHDWDAAITLSAEDGFKLPTINQLQSIVYCASNTVEPFKKPGDNEACSTVEKDATILNHAFPGTPNEIFWTASMVDSITRRAWYVNFETGASANHGSRSAHRYIRLVREMSDASLR